MSDSPTDCDLLEDRTCASCTNLLMTSMCYLLGIYYSQIVKFVSFGFEIENCDKLDNKFIRKRC